MAEGAPTKVNVFVAVTTPLTVTVIVEVPATPLAKR